MAEVMLNLHPDQIKALVPVYDGKNMTVANWLARVEQYAIIYGWKDEQKFLYSSTRLGGVPLLWYNSVCVSINAWAEFYCRIRAKFTKERDTMDVHFTLMNIQKMAIESYVEFAYRVNEIAANNNVEEQSIKFTLENKTLDTIRWMNLHLNSNIANVTNAVIRKLIVALVQKW